MSDPVRVLLVGAGGRMGKSISAAAETEAALTIAAGAERDADLAALAKSCDVIVDFSTAEATGTVCHLCATQKLPLILGTTGHTAVQNEVVRATAEKVAIVFAANFSLGVNVLFALALALAGSLSAQVLEPNPAPAPAAPAATRRSRSAARTTAGPRTRCAARWRR